jgi:hypothetical protein
LQNQTLIGDDELAAEQRQQNLDLQKQFRKMFTSLRLKYDEVFLENGKSRSRSFREEMRRVQSSPKRFDISLAKVFYDGVAGTNLSREKIREFISNCEPMRATIYAYLMGRYDLALRDLHHSERFQSGRNDLYMATYLPYCDEFVTDEKHGEQERCLREIAEVLGLRINVLSYAEFYEGLLREHASETSRA